MPLSYANTTSKLLLCQIKSAKLPGFRKRFKAKWGQRGQCYSDEPSKSQPLPVISCPSNLGMISGQTRSLEEPCGSSPKHPAGEVFFVPWRSELQQHRAQGEQRRPTYTSRICQRVMSLGPSSAYLSGSSDCTKLVERVARVGSGL